MYLGYHCEDEEGDQQHTSQEVEMLRDKRPQLDQQLGVGRLTPVLRHIATGRKGKPALVR